MFCISESVALIIPNVANFFTKPLRGIETAAQINEELKRTEFDGASSKKKITLLLLLPVLRSVIDILLNFFFVIRSAHLHKSYNVQLINCNVLQCCNTLRGHFHLVTTLKRGEGVEMSKLDIENLPR